MSRAAPGGKYKCLKIKFAPVGESGKVRQMGKEYQLGGTLPEERSPHGNVYAIENCDNYIIDKSFGDTGLNGKCLFQYTKWQNEK